MKKLWKPFTLKPYGEKLVDGVVDNWLLFVRLNILAIALCDAVAWSYWASITAAGAAGYAIAAATFLIVFTIVGSVDATFVMHDTTAQRRVVSMPGRSPITRAMQWARQNIRAGHVAIVARILLVAISFHVTAPMLAQFFFSRDIEAAIQRSNEQNTAAKRAAITANFDRMLDAARAKLAARTHDLEVEVAGAGASGRYGDGPTAKAIRRDIAQYENEIRDRTAAKAAELATFNTATSELLASRYGIDVKREGPDTRAHALAEMERSPAFRAMQTNIKWFLAFMFLVLLTLKFFQPEAVKNYFSARLQAKYHSYENGVYNVHLHPSERPDAGGMTPGQFARWYDDHQRDLEENESMQQHVKLARIRFDMQSQGYRDLADKLAGDMAEMQQDRENANNANDALHQRLATEKSKLAALKDRIAVQEKELGTFKFENSADNDVSLAESEFLVKRKQAFERQLAANRAAVVETESLIGKLTQSIEDNRLLRENIAQAIEERGRRIQEIDHLMNEALRQNMEDIASAG